MKGNNLILKVVVYIICASFCGYTFYDGLVSNTIYVRSNEVHIKDNFEAYYIQLGFWAMGALFFIYLLIEVLVKALLEKLRIGND